MVWFSVQGFSWTAGRQLPLGLLSNNKSYKTRLAQAHVKMDIAHVKDLRMIKIDFREFLFHRVIFGFHTGRRLRKIQGVKVDRHYYYGWKWKFNFSGTGSTTVPWHRCWVYKHLVRDYVNDKD
jgi:hypothetical protein